MSSKPGRSPEFPPPQQGISLHELTEAFAQAMGRREQAEPAEGPGAQPGDVPPPAEPPLSAEQAQQAPLEPAVEGADDDACPLSPQAILEAMLFVGNRDNEPLTRQAAELMRGVDPGEIADLVAALNRRYEAGGRPYQIISDGPGYRLTLRKGYEAIRRQFYGRVRETRLSQAAVDILAIVAYQQPITAEQVSQLRGRPSSRALSQLVRAACCGSSVPTRSRASPLLHGLPFSGNLRVTGFAGSAPKRGFGVRPPEPPALPVQRLAGGPARRVSISKP